MGSTFVTFDKIKSDSEKLFANKKPDAIFLQFVPGNVVDVVTSSDHYAYNNKSRNINSILAKPHYGDKFKRTSTVDENDRYYPMFRGMVDVPMKGDPVLLCTMGQVQYYIGPLNTVNRPDWNIDHLNMPDIRVATEAFSGEKITDRDLLKISKNFTLTRTARLEKKYNNPLDNPENTKEFIGDIHGDILFEGRHGNSIRVGSRDINPYIFLSNGRKFDNTTEGIGDGSLISITAKGTLQQHFGSYDDFEKQETISGFTLADSSTQNPTRTSSQLISFVNSDNNPSEIIYGYDKNQILINSDRIMFNSKKDDIFMSSFKDIHIGAGNHFTLSVQNDMIIEAKNIYLGKQVKRKIDSGPSNAKNMPQPLVLGEQLRLILEELVGILETFKVSGTIAGLSSLPSPDVKLALQSLKQKLSVGTSPFLSEYHFIEDNGQKTD